MMDISIKVIEEMNRDLVGLVGSGFVGCRFGIPSIKLDYFARR